MSQNWIPRPTIMPSRRTITIGTSNERGFRVQLPEGWVDRGHGNDLSHHHFTSPTGERYTAHLSPFGVEFADTLGWPVYCPFGQPNA